MQISSESILVSQKAARKQEVLFTSHELKSSSNRDVASLLPPNTPAHAHSQRLHGRTAVDDQTGASDVATRLAGQ